MTTKTLYELFEHELKDIYYAENHILIALQTMIKESSNENIKQNFQNHFEETKVQVERLKKVFSIIGKEPRTQKCDGIMGLIAEKKAFNDEKPTKEIKEFYNLGAATKVERYEISAYESLIDNAKKNEMNEVVELLEKSLEEEENALEKVKSLIQDFNTSEIAGGMI